MRRKDLLIGILCFLLLCTGCHKHTLGPAATCTEDQVCLECGKVLKEALGHNAGEEATCSAPQVCTRCETILAEKLPHTPGEGPTCTQPQVCTVCGEMLKGAKGHDVNDEGVCVVCQEQVVEPGQRYVRPGKGNYVSENTAGLVDETCNEGHYNNDIEAYYSNSVLICGDYAVEYFTPDSTGSDNYASIVNDFARKYPNIRVTSVIVPKCCAFESPKDYANAGEYIQKFIASTYGKMDASVKKADCYGEMAPHAGEYMFYRTDHHWTSLGAYYASVAYCKANDIEPRALESYESVIRTNVEGTLSFFSGYDANLKRNLDYTVCRFPATGYSMQSYYGYWYNSEAVQADNHEYAYVFMGGDVPISVIRTDQHNGKSLLIFKESYGNAFAPYMIDYYETILVVDIRQDTESVASLVDQYNITDAVIINNCQAVYSFQTELRNKTQS